MHSDEPHGHEAEGAVKNDCLQKDVMSYLGVSKNRGTPKSSILIGFSIINHPF